MAFDQAWQQGGPARIRNPAFRGAERAHLRLAARDQNAPACDGHSFGPLRLAGISHHIRAEDG